MLAWKSKNPKAIAAISLLAILSAVFLCKFDTEYYDGSAMNAEDEHLRRYLAIPSSTATANDDDISCIRSAIAPIYPEHSPRELELFKRSSTYRKHSPSELELLERSYECTKTHISDDLGRLSWPSFEANIPMLDCEGDNDEEQKTDSLAFVQSAMKKYHHIYFVGDSVMGQQFTLMKCMLDPESREEHYDLPVEFNHSTNSISVISEASLASDSFPSTATHIEWVRWGYHPNNGRGTVPYERVLPDIMAKATVNDAIIIDAATHYNHERMLLLKKALEFIKEHAMKSDATVFYMEPTPQEFPTRNGNFGVEVHGEACVKLTDDAVLGKDIEYPEEPVSCSQDDHACIKQASVVLELLYPHRQPAMNVPPATWRSDLARYVFATSNTNDGAPRFEKGGDRDVHDHGVNFVPIFWQLVKTGQESTIGAQGDCTHRSVSATFLMNFQLLRALKDSCTHMFQMEED